MGQNDEILLALGRLQGTMDGVQDHVLAVSRKADRIEETLETRIDGLRAELKTHAESQDAHGVKPAKDAVDRLGGVIAWVVGIVGGLVGIAGAYKALNP